jgi:hypothetical protein
VPTIVIGDVHGCLEELDELLRAVDARPGASRVVFLGDLVDRGPDSAGVVRRVRELGAECVMGNHEDKHVRWARHEARRAAHGTANPMRRPSDAWLAGHAALDADALDYLAALPVSLDLGDGWHAVHAGASATRPFADQKPAVQQRIRYVDDRGAMVSMSDGRTPAGARRWAEVWPGPESIVYGHAVHDLEAPTRDARGDVRCVGIDTGCCFGGRLTAWLKDCDEVVQVPARRAYADLKTSLEDEP